MITSMPSPEQVSFLKQRINPIVFALFGKKYRLPLIQAHFNDNLQLSLMRYRKPGDIRNLAISSLELPGVTTRMPLQCMIERGQPLITVFVTDWQFIFNSLKHNRGSSFEELFEMHLVVGLCHELDHFALGTLEGPLPELERITWARTCKCVLGPMKEVYGWDLDENETLYREWVESGGNKESIKWKACIAKRYGYTMPNQ